MLEIYNIYNLMRFLNKKSEIYNRTLEFTINNIKLKSNKQNLIKQYSFD